MGALSGCGKKGDDKNESSIDPNHQHVFDKCIEDDKYLVDQNWCGYKEYYKSCECGQASDSLKFQKWAGHKEENIVHHNAVDGTCTERGWKEYWECTKCEKCFLTQEFGENDYVVDLNRLRTDYGPHEYDEFGLCKYHSTSYIGNTTQLDKTYQANHEVTDKTNDNIIFRTKVANGVRNYKLESKIIFKDETYYDESIMWKYKIHYGGLDKFSETQNVMTSTGTVNVKEASNDTYIYFALPFADVSNVKKVLVTLNCEDHEYNDFGCCIHSGVSYVQELDGTLFNPDDKNGAVQFDHKGYAYVKYGYKEGGSAEHSQEDYKDYCYIVLSSTSATVEKITFKYKDSDTTSYDRTPSGVYSFGTGKMIYKILFDYDGVFYIKLKFGKDKTADIWITGHTKHQFDSDTHICSFHDKKFDPAYESQIENNAVNPGSKCTVTLQKNQTKIYKMAYQFNASRFEIEMSVAYNDYLKWKVYDEYGKILVTQLLLDSDSGVHYGTISSSTGCIYVQLTNNGYDGTMTVKFEI